MNLKAWEPSVEDILSNSVIYQITRDIHDGVPDPEQAKRLLKLFSDCSTWAETILLPDELFNYFKYAIHEYLDKPEPGKLESKLGLIRTKGKPQQNRNRNHLIAWKVLQGRLTGKSLEKISLDLSDNFDLPDNRIRDIWAKNKIQALDFECVYRAKKSNENKANWSIAELERLRKIYGHNIK